MGVTDAAKTAELLAGPAVRRTPTTAERFAHDFGFATAYRDDVEVHLRGTLPGSPCMIIRTLTGTPGGVALQPPPALVQRLAGLLPDAKRWELFVRGHARSGAYLKPGDRVVAAIRTADGALDLGAQHTTVR